METIQVVTLVAALIAVVLSALTLRKVNKLMVMLRSPIVKKLSPDMNLRPSSRRPVSAQDMAARGERQKESRQTKEPQQRQNNKENRETANNQRRERRNNNRNEARHRREVPAVEKVPAAVEPAAEAVSPIVIPEPTSVPVQEQPVRRPLPPRIAKESVPEVAPEAPQAPAPAVVEAAAAVAPEKLRYGRRNVVRKVPELDEI